MVPQLPFVGFVSCFTFFRSGTRRIFKVSLTNSIRVNRKCLLSGRTPRIRERVSASIFNTKVAVSTPPKYTHPIPNHPIPIRPLFSIVFPLPFASPVGFALSHCCFCKLCGLLFLLAHTKIAGSIQTN